MRDSRPPLLIEPDALEKFTANANLLVVDLSKEANYRKAHVPGAVHLDYAGITTSRQPVMGLLPEMDVLESLFSSSGIDAHTHVVACDDEGGGRAARLLWTLEMAGHQHYSLLNGGLRAWANEGHELTHEAVTPVAKAFHAKYHAAAAADCNYILEHLENPDTCLLDARSPEEHRGTKKLAARGGHIPGAVNIEWTAMMDPSRNQRLLPDTKLRTLLESRGVTPDREVIVYCQTHHRSAFSYLALRHLGYERVRGYPGSWSDWGNNPDLPVEV